MPFIKLPFLFSLGILSITACGRDLIKEASGGSHANEEAPSQALIAALSPDKTADDADDVVRH